MRPELLYYPTGLFSKKSKFALKSGPNNWHALLTGALLSGVYCKFNRLISLKMAGPRWAYKPMSTALCFANPYPAKSGSINRSFLQPPLLCPGGRVRLS